MNRIGIGARARIQGQRVLFSLFMKIEYSLATSLVIGKKMQNENYEF